MKNRWEKVCAFVVAFALVLPLVCGQQMTAKAAVALVEFKPQGGDTNVSLEIGDKVTMEISLNTTTNNVHSITGNLDYSSEYFETVTGADVEVDSAAAVEGWDVGLSGNKFTAFNSAASGLTATADVVLARVTFTVKKAVKDTIDVGFKEISISAASKETNDNISVSLKNKATREVIFSIPSETKAPVGNVLSIPVRIEKNSGFNSLKLKIKALPDLFTFTGLEFSSAAKAEIECKTSYVSGGEISISFVSDNDTKLTGEFVVLNFQTTGDTSKVGGKAAISAQVDAVGNESEAPITGSFSTGACEVKFTSLIVRGDVNSDGKIDLIDATYVLQYYNGVRTLTLQERQRADVNQSGTNEQPDVTLVDVLLIMRYYNEKRTDWNIANWI
ncbi:MAG: dockerin type I domain-containing protein [Agathobacter sp.]|nr:dockerin type I domain-containing protein [Agathobacter sp.]